MNLAFISASIISFENLLKDWCLYTTEPNSSKINCRSNIKEERGLNGKRFVIRVELSDMNSSDVDVL